MKETTNKYIAGFAETSEGWSIKSLGELADIYRGASPRPIKDPKWFSEKSTHGWIRISDVTKSKKYLLKTEQYLSPDGINNSRTVSPGDLIMSICGTIGRPIILKINACIHDGFVVFSNLKEHLVDTEYLRYTILTLTEYFKSQGQPGTQVNLNTSIVEKAKVLLPPLKEQQKIAEILSTVDQQIEQTEKIIEKTKELKKGLMQQLLTKGIGHKEFKKTELGELPNVWEVDNNFIKIKSGFGFKLNEYSQEGIPLIRINNIGYSKMKIEDVIKLPESYLVEFAEFVLKKGDVLLALNRPVTNKQLKIAKYNVDAGILYQRVGKLQVDATKYDIDFYYQYLQSTDFVKRLEETFVGSDQPFIKVNEFNKMLFHIPPIQEQKAIAKILSAVDEDIENHEEEKQKYEELKKGLMQQLLTGKVRVKID